ncbi:MAG: phosphoribosylformylglycinamidine synthase subunit PurL [Actinomycetota bacterium]
MSVEQALALALTEDEYHRICDTLGREPTPAELAMYGAMWSEHCSYKSSKVHLKTLPTEGPRVVMGPGESAGIIDIGDGMVAVFKLESHNHPSFVEPVQGAATGVGGIVRDIISAGARPVALLDPLRFGDPSKFPTMHLVEGVVHGISQYGNSIGIPTVGGELRFDPCYQGNPLVNVMCVGVGRLDEVQRAVAEGEGNVAILFGSKTGRDGIGGVSVLASRPFDDEAEAKRPSVQVGDPFTEKVIIEVSVELARRGLLVGLQDLGGGGFCCATSETASRGGTGLEVDLDAVALREADMEAFEILTSESQERMLAIVKPEDVDQALEICSRWGAWAAPVATVIEGGNLKIAHSGEVVADMPARSLADEGPVYERPMRRPDWLDALQADDPMRLEPPKDLGDALLELLASPNICSKGWVYEQYDQIVQHNTLQSAGGDAAVIRIEGIDRAMAISTDGCGRFGQLDPRLGAMLAVVESARNVACTGARPVAITNCLNFGNPEYPEVMWQFAEAVKGIGEACRVLETPVTGGNVSFYNQTGDTQIHPTPIIGMVGLLEGEPLTNSWQEGDEIVLLGETRPELGGSEWAWVARGHLGGMPPQVDLDLERRLCGLLSDLYEADRLTAAHDCSDGGLLVALAEMAIASGIAATVDISVVGLPEHVAAFSESTGRVIVSAQDSATILTAAADVGIPARVLGRVGGESFNFGTSAVALDEMTRAHRDAFGRLFDRTTN